MADRERISRVTAGLREFGYPDLTETEVEEVFAAYAEGKRGDDLPHGIIGSIIEAQIQS